MTIKHYHLIDKLPKNIIPFGLGKNNFPQNWLNEKQGEHHGFKQIFWRSDWNILDLEKPYE